MLKYRKVKITLNGIAAIIGSPQPTETLNSFEESVELHIRAPEGSTWHIEGKVADDDESPFAKLIRILRGPQLRGPYPPGKPDENEKQLCIFTGTAQDPHSLLVWLKTQGVEVRITRIPWINNGDSYETWDHYRELVDADTIYEGQPPLLNQEGFWSSYWFLTVIILVLLLVALVFFTES